MYISKKKTYIYVCIVIYIYICIQVTTKADSSKINPPHTKTCRLEECPVAAPSWRILGPSWLQVGGSWDHLKLGGLGAILDSS